MPKTKRVLDSLVCLGEVLFCNETNLGEITSVTPRAHHCYSPLAVLWGISSSPGNGLLGHLALRAVQSGFHALIHFVDDFRGERIRLNSVPISFNPSAFYDGIVKTKTRYCAATHP